MVCICGLCWQSIALNWNNMLSNNSFHGLKMKVIYPAIMIEIIYAMKFFHDSRLAGHRLAKRLRVVLLVRTRNPLMNQSVLLGMENAKSVPAKDQSSSVVVPPVPNAIIRITCEFTDKVSAGIV